MCVGLPRLLDIYPPDTVVDTARTVARPAASLLGGFGAIPENAPQLRLATQFKLFAARRVGQTLGIAGEPTRMAVFDVPGVGDFVGGAVFVRDLEVVLEGTDHADQVMAQAFGHIPGAVAPAVVREPVGVVGGLP